jgi:hypothetical protein
MIVIMKDYGVYSACWLHDHGEAALVAMHQR